MYWDDKVVALHPEGVDRNKNQRRGALKVSRSLSPRRAWIEIETTLIVGIVGSVALPPEGVDRNAKNRAQCPWAFVALHPEGVDRNAKNRAQCPWAFVALHPEGVDRNPDHPFKVRDDEESPSIRRAWIEIYFFAIWSASAYSRPPPGGRG